MTPLLIVIIGASVGAATAWLSSSAGRHPEDADSLLVAAALGVVGALVAAVPAQAWGPGDHVATITTVCAIVGAGIASMSRHRWVDAA